jgi:hypothetical protein
MMALVTDLQNVAHKAILFPVICPVTVHQKTQTPIPHQNRLHDRAAICLLGVD